MIHYAAYFRLLLCVFVEWFLFILWSNIVVHEQWNMPCFAGSPFAHGVVLCDVVAVCLAMGWQSVVTVVKHIVAILFM